MRCDASFKRYVLLSCYEALASVGFVRYRKEAVDFPVADGFHAWVGLNNTLESDHVEISPFVGIHVVPIMSFYTRLEQRKYDRGIATYAVHMGDLAPNELAFKFSVETDVQAEAARLARLYLSVGVPYAESIASYERLLPLLQERVPMLGGYPERVASCLYLMGRLDDARHFVETFLASHEEYFRNFAVPFLKLTVH